MHLKEVLDWLLKALSAIVVAIPFTGKVSTSSKLWYKKISWRGWSIIGLTIIILIVNTKVSDISDLQNQHKLDNANKHYEQLIEKLQMSGQQQVSKSKDEVIFTLAKKYNLIWDSAKNVIYQSNTDSKKVIDRMLKDSSIREAKYTSVNRPVLIEKFLLVKLTKDSVVLQIKLECEGSSAYNLNIPVQYGYFSYLGHPRKIGVITDFADNDMLSLGSIRTATIELPLAGYINTLIFYFKGSYTDVPKINISYPFERLIEYRLDKRETFRIQPSGYHLFSDFTK